MPRCGETAHVEPDFGDDDLRRQRADTGDLIEAVRGGEPVAATVSEGVVGRGRSPCGGLCGEFGGGLGSVVRAGGVDRTAGLLVAGLGGGQGLQE